MKILIIFTVFMLKLNYIYCKINSVTDDELIDHIRNEERLVVVYTKKDCDECDKYESIVENLYQDITEHLNAKVVKAFNSPMAALFSPSKEPAIVYYRRGLPLLYHGPLSEEAIISNFYDNPEPIVRELSDENFEHLTQAATGATTGDWFIFYYTTDCTSCQRLHACWEAVGAALKHRMNVARVNVQYKGKTTGKRFGIDSTPEFIFFRLGKMYRYKSKNYTPSAFINFVTDEYKDLKPEIVPPEYSEPIYHKALESIVNVLQQPYVTAGIGIFMIIVVVIFICIKMKSAAKKTKKTK